MVATSRSAVLRRAASFLSLLAFELAAVVLLTRLGSVPELRIPWHSLTPWLLNSPVEDVLAAILRNIALLIAWWLLGSNLLYLLASLTRVPSAIRAVRWLTLPVVRRATDHALALTLATSLMGGGTGAAIAGTAPVAVMAPQVPGPVAADHPNPEAAGPLAYAPNPAGPPREQAPARAASLPGYVPRSAGLLAQQPTQTTSGQPGYVPRPAGNPPAAPPQPTSTSPSSTTGPSSSSTTTPPSTLPPTSTTGYVPRPAGPPSSTAPPKTTTPPRSTAPESTAPESTAPPTTAPPRTTAPPGSTAPPRTTAPPGSTAPPRTTGPPGSTVPETRPPTTTTPPTTTAPPGGNQPSPSPQPPEGQPTRSHRVVQGDNLWTISRDHLAAVTNQRSSDLSDHEIAAYWLRVIAVNRSSLRSGNPDVIFPDELIMLPPLSGGA